MRPALSHEEGVLVLENLNNFYNSFTSDQINILRINPKSVSYDENKLIRRFLGQDRQVVDSSSKQNYVKNGSKVNLKFLEEKIKDSEIISDIIDWIVENEENPELLKNFRKLTPENLSKLNTLSGIVTLKNCLLRWEENLLHSSEDFWQKEFEDNSYVISQLFTSPVTIMQSKAYLGGKNIDNTGGSLVDYLFVNKLTKNTSIIELKTPGTRLLGSNYRNTIYNISAELSGAIVQLSNYKDELLKNYYPLTHLNKGIFHAYDPSCILIVGNFATELDSEEKVKSFELFRQQLQNIQIITFDELFEKMRLLIHLLEGS
ncbi:PF14082 domain protein [Leptospira borgpetersenii serovar Pomona str. 200901868]|uniref:PF14082 domain protein n=1 Tax=Leptospira borgpetersenii serovar Pomona str. 200901868 TaxID=1192866 RepID=M6W4I9_LEPBO|nr:PF14082 domain protein [Leptospira borgpetersenii serovar Pomona str. 200901868]